MWTGENGADGWYKYCTLLQRTGLVGCFLFRALPHVQLELRNVTQATSIRACFLVSRKLQPNRLVRSSKTHGRGICMVPALSPALTKITSRLIGPFTRHHKHKPPNLFDSNSRSSKTDQTRQRLNLEENSSTSPLLHGIMSKKGMFERRESAGSGSSLTGAADHYPKQISRN